ncbi:tryptophan-rich sensory protein [Cellulophaga baltica]|uniref:tryptophan-rich sensory protein n=1 Tax=Cellulophaga TaxID=104264 RepID=UPI001C073083|nr:MULTISPECIES: tryptophan-rich sensory protein [Cellulophaga]MBU2997773.1 tryptophan-rich sensory protein [Cellulophaga baltica]MDO6769169.1 tryptophan-rich sensory protein [Cellulophaga sp. 1_MG-2023]
MKKKLAILNSVSVLFVILINYLSQALEFNNTTIGDISNKYDNLFTPEGYAFAIWGPIFLALIGYAIFQVKRAFFSDKKSDFIIQTGYWFAIANFLNAFWVLAFVYDYTGLSVLIMLGILFSLIKIILNTNMERWDAPIEVIALVWWPICVYSGWISVATIANTAAYFSKIGWQGGFLTEIQWTIAMIIIATIINLLITYKRNMREFGLVGIWALLAIFVRHSKDHTAIAYTALICAILIFIVTMSHAYINRKSGPTVKLKERLNKGK